MRRRWGIACLGLLALAGCSTKPKDEFTVNASMAEIMEPMAEKIWAYASQAYNDVGDGLVAEKLSDADWKGLGEAGRRLKERAQYFAEAEKVVVAHAGQPIMGSQGVGGKKPGNDWDPVDAATVQARIDKQPDLFRQKAQVLVGAADAVVRASMTKDAALFYKVSSEMDEVCDGCHEVFWGTDEPPAFPKQ